jgi:AbrB family looped-hinge helix DNA binding protein
MVEERVIGLSKTTSKFMITLTKEVREKLGIKPGDKVLFIERNGEIIIRKA